ncbi:MAG: hypothetical protein M1828_006249 [Chrysothrix sp. TS-e1954]|nr:MAG: hypothetical protein M1828_006249 [Chrysothrix sp. TS-e1954]
MISTTPSTDKDLLKAGSRPRRPSQTSVLTLPVSSKPSSSSMYQSAISLQPGARRNGGHHKLRSQYPNDPNIGHVEFILVATFDIDRGSMMEHQFPAPISGDETMLAELMLPDQVHSRAQDWTIFFLHKEGNMPEEPNTPSKDSAHANAEGADDDEDASASEAEEDDLDDPFEGPPLIYVLNHVNTKHDTSVQRGAVVKAMAICTRHSFLDIFKPILVLAIEEYFKSPTIETLEMLYDSLNSMDLSLMPRLSLLERIILQASNSDRLFIEKFQRMIEQRQAEDAEATEEDGTKPGGLHKAASMKHDLPRDTHEFQARINFNNHSVPVKIPTARSTETVGNFSIIKLIQTFSAPHATSPQPFALHPHLTTGGAYTPPIIVLVNAVLTQKRIIFLGHGRPSEEVAEAVLAACALASGGVLRGFTRHAFPYTDLTKVDDLQKVPGFIAGVTNPIFASTPRWWDLLCDIPSGRMKISNLIEQPQITDGQLAFQQQNPTTMTATSGSQSGPAHDITGDAAFMESVQRNILSRHGEGAIRSMWRDWVVRLTRIAAAFEEIVYGASALYIGGDQADVGDYGLKGHGYVWRDDASRLKDLAANVSRIEGWRNTRSYYSFKQDLIHLYNSRPIRNVDLDHHHDRLRTQKLTQDQSAAIFLGFGAAIQTDNEICQLLTVTSESHGGLWYISLGLLHPRKDVRQQTAQLLSRISRHEAGKHSWAGLSGFSKFAFYRIQREMI